MMTSFAPFAMCSCRWSSEGLFNGPTSPESLVDRGDVHLNTFSPFGKASCFAVPCEQMICSHVPGLLFWRRPFAIVRSVSKRVVDALQGMTRRRLRPNICKKRTEIFSPTIADANTSRAIVYKIFRSGIFAASNHSAPTVVLGATVHSVFSSCHASRLVYQASATTNSAAIQSRRSDERVVTAGTAAAPDDIVSVSLWRRFYSGEPSGHFPCDVYRACLHLRSMLASMMRRTSSAIEMPRRFASLIKNFRCGTVNEIICLINAELRKQECFYDEHAVEAETVTFDKTVAVNFSAFIAFDEIHAHVQFLVARFRDFIHYCFTSLERENSRLMRTAIFGWQGYVKAGSCKSSYAFAIEADHHTVSIPRGISQ